MVNGDPTGIWPGAKSGEKLGAALPRLCFFFYLFRFLLLPPLPRRGHSHRSGPPAQPSQRQRQPPQQQPTTFQTQVLPLFAWTIPLHVQNQQQVCFFPNRSSSLCPAGFIILFCKWWMFVFYALDLVLLRSSTPVKPPSSVASSLTSMRPPTPSTSVSLPYGRGSGSSGPHRPPSRASAGALFTSSPGLPPPPPLLQGAAHSAIRNVTFHCSYNQLGCFAC